MLSKSSVANHTENGYYQSNSVNRTDEMRSSPGDYESDEHLKTTAHHSRTGIVDLLERQIRHCTSATELQRAHRLTAQKKPTTKISSSTFKSVIDELNVETTSTTVVATSTRTSIHDSNMSDDGELKTISDPTGDETDGRIIDQSIPRLSVAMEATHLSNRPIWTSTDTGVRRSYSRKAVRWQLRLARSPWVNKLSACDISNLRYFF